MKNLFLIFILLTSLSVNAAYMCDYQKSMGTAQEEHNVGFGYTREVAIQRAFEKCSDNWSSSSCNSYFSIKCNDSKWGCAYIKGMGTESEERYPGFGYTKKRAQSRAFSRCSDDWGESTCNSGVYVKCVEDNENTY